MHAAVLESVVSLTRRRRRHRGSPPQRGARAGGATAGLPLVTNELHLRSFPGFFPVCWATSRGQLSEPWATPVRTLAPGDRVVLCPAAELRALLLLASATQPTRWRHYSMSLYRRTPARRDDATVPRRPTGTRGRVGGWAEEHGGAAVGRHQRWTDESTWPYSCVSAAPCYGRGRVCSTPPGVEVGATVLVTGAGGHRVAVIQGGPAAAASTDHRADHVGPSDAEGRGAFARTAAVDP